MYKMIRVFNVIEEELGDGRCQIKSADYEILDEFGSFDVDDDNEHKLLKFCKDNNLKYGRYDIVKYLNNNPVSVCGVLHYYSDEEHKEGLSDFLSCSEWNERCEVSAALEADIVPEHPINILETFSFIDEVDTKDYVKALQSSLDDVTGLIMLASCFIPNSQQYAEGIYPISKYAKIEDYTTFLAMVSLITNIDKLDAKPEIIKKIINLVEKA